MKTSILNNEFKDIKTAALYKANEDVPFKVLYLGSNTKINKNNFSKYSNKFEPASENDELLINFLGDITKIDFNFLQFLIKKPEAVKFFTFLLRAQDLLKTKVGSYLIILRTAV